MRISDWSSDVCSSDLCHHRHRLHKPGQVRRGRNLPGPGTGTATRPAWPEPSGSPGDHAGDGAPGAAARKERKRGDPAARRAGPTPGARSEEQTSELQSLMRISYAVFCLKKKKPAMT